jgi:hypothetical protein
MKIPAERGEFIALHFHPCLTVHPVVEGSRMQEHTDALAISSSGKNMFGYFRMRVGKTFSKEEQALFLCI